MKPTDLEVNNKLAEYDGARLELVVSWDAKKPYHRVIDSNGSYKVLYTESLDAQIPIWKKLGGKYIQIWTNINEVCCSDGPDNNRKEGFGKTIPQASAYALYYAILEDEK